MIRKPGLIALRESCGSDERFVDQIHHHLGLCDENGRRHLDHLGRQQIRFPDGIRESERIRLDEFNWRGLTEAIFGTDDASAIQRQFNGPNVQLALLLQEAGEGAVLPSHLSNVNTLNAIYSGLIQASVLEGYTLPEFINSQLATEETTNIFEGRKSIGVTLQNPRAEGRQPSQPTKRAQVGERWITQPLTVENSLAIELTYEAVFADNLTGGGLMTAARDIGRYVQLQREYAIIDAFIGVTNTYSYKNNVYNTYMTGGYYTNRLTANPLMHWTNIQRARVAFRNMRAVEVNQPLTVRPSRVLCNEELVAQAGQVKSPTTAVQYRDPASTTQPMNIRIADNPYPGAYDVLTTPYLYERQTAADGLGMDATTAGSTWYYYEPGWLKWVVNWPFRVQEAIATSMDMIDRGLVAFFKADERGIPMVEEPRRVLDNRAA
ncbi:hypothetical protein KIH39_00015 [Telmatocola sphagniphila]|uniref:Uncharacterized protein n=1 Tax=Telmatocola sphagniphila TaxID=1123043 RepID=A0A8E6B6F9_9BACT|nr:hypothetical protein [Telmatocola sphagniphila]QVL32339.1 hypothetical protein KIH39_00015 [Telmatocola sphagniphila]